MLALGRKKSRYPEWYREMVRARAKRLRDKSRIRPYFERLSTRAIYAPRLTIPKIEIPSLSELSGMERKRKKK